MRNGMFFFKLTQLRTDEEKEKERNCEGKCINNFFFVKTTKTNSCLIKIFFFILNSSSVYVSWYHHQYFVASIFSQFLFIHQQFLAMMHFHYFFFYALIANFMLTFFSTLLIRTLSASFDKILSVCTHLLQRTFHSLCMCVVQLQYS